jgi:glycosyltransferase involved in cell wall biosynthesis
VRVENRPGERVVRALERFPGRRTGNLELESFVHVTSPVPQNALARMLDDFRPDVVVGNSLVRLSWRRTRAVAAERGLPTVLYVREDDSLDHLRPGEEPDAIVANAEALRSAIQQRGFECSVVPSVIDVERTQTSSTREVVLAVNPIESRGVATVWRVAAALPDIPFVVQESWPLHGADLQAVERQAEALPNVEFRRVTPSGPELYGDARLLMVPYRVDNRPRVIAEAQANALPVIAADLPALREAVHGGGLLVDLDDIEAWVAAIRSLYEDSNLYERLASAAAEHSRRPEIDPVHVVAAFEEVLEAVRR